MDGKAKRGKAAGEAMAGMACKACRGIPKIYYTYFKLLT